MLDLKLVDNGSEPEKARIPSTGCCDLLNEKMVREHQTAPTNSRLAGRRRPHLKDPEHELVSSMALSEGVL